MEFGEDIVVWVLTIAMFFMSIIIIISGENAIKFKIDTMQQDVIDGIYGEIVVSSLQDGVPAEAYSFSYDCGGFVMPMFTIHTGSKTTVLVGDFPGEPWKGREEIEAGKVVLFGRQALVDTRVKRFVWKGLCNALASVAEGEHEVLECDGCDIRFFDDSSMECVSYASGIACSRTSVPVENRGFMGISGSVYAIYDDNAREVKIWRK